jgi:hypothetical protein
MNKAASFRKTNRKAEVNVVVKVDAVAVKVAAAATVAVETKAPSKADREVNKVVNSAAAAVETVVEVLLHHLVRKNGHATTRATTTKKKMTTTQTHVLVVKVVTVDLVQLKSVHVMNKAGSCQKMNLKVKVVTSAAETSNAVEVPVVAAQAVAISAVAVLDAAVVVVVAAADHRRMHTIVNCTNKVVKVTAAVATKVAKEDAKVVNNVAAVEVLLHHLVRKNGHATIRAMTMKKKMTTTQTHVLVVKVVTVDLVQLKSVHVMNKAGSCQRMNLKVRVVTSAVATSNAVEVQAAVAGHRRTRTITDTTTCANAIVNATADVAETVTVLRRKRMIAGICATVNAIAIMVINNNTVVNKDNSTDVAHNNNMVRSSNSVRSSTDSRVVNNTEESTISNNSMDEDNSSTAACTINRISTPVVSSNTVAVSSKDSMDSKACTVEASSTSNMDNKASTVVDSSMVSKVFPVRSKVVNCMDAINNSSMVVNSNTVDTSKVSMAVVACSRIMVNKTFLEKVAGRSSTNRNLVLVVTV